MEIREAREGDVVVLVPDASVTGNDETRAIEAKLEATIKAGAKLLVVDCGAIKQLTSAAVRVLLAVSRRLDRTGGRLVLCDMNAQLKKAFTISGVEKDFTVLATRAEAVQRVREPAAPARPAKSDAAAPTPPPTPVPSPAPAPPDSPAPAAVAVPAEMPAAMVYEALAVRLLEALGVPSMSVAADRVRGGARPGLETLADGLLEALHAGGAWAVSTVVSAPSKGEA